MPIEKGEPWGEELDGDVPGDVVRCADDSALAAAVWDRLDSGEVDPPLFAIVGGDLSTTLGGSGSGRLVLPMDLCLAELDGEGPLPFVAHLIAHRRWWHGQAAAVMNAAWSGQWYLGPRAHPNDGLVDITVGALGVRQRWEARRRAPSASHLPHPDLTVTRRSAWSHRFDRATTVELDGRRVGSHHEVSVTVMPDAFRVLN